MQNDLIILLQKKRCLYNTVDLGRPSIKILLDQWDVLEYKNLTNEIRVLNFFCISIRGFGSLVHVHSFTYTRIYKNMAEQMLSSSQAEVQQKKRKTTGYSHKHSKKLRAEDKESMLAATHRVAKMPWKDMVDIRRTMGLAELSKETVLEVVEGAHKVIGARPYDGVDVPHHQRFGNTSS